MVAKLWWIVHRDLVSEWRACRVWPAMFVLAIVVALLLTIEVGAPVAAEPETVARLYWLAVFFAGVLAFDRAFAAEREENGWEGLLLAPVSPAVVYLAKLAAANLVLGALQLVLLPVFAAFSGLPLLEHAPAMVAVALLGNLGLAAVGVFLGAVTAGIRQGSGLLALLALPLIVPAMLAASEAMRLLLQNDFGPGFSRAVQLLAGFAVVFVTAGTVLFQYVMED